MPLALRHGLGRPVQPLLHRDHLPAGEALLAPSVPAQPDQFRRSFHRRHHGVELVQPVGMAMNEHRQIAAGEGRLLPGDRVQGDVRDWR